MMNIIFTIYKFRKRIMYKFNRSKLLEDYNLG